MGPTVWCRASSPAWSRFASVWNMARSGGDQLTETGHSTMSLRTELVLLSAIGPVFAVICVWLIGRGAPLGHDEASYALKARTLANGTSSTYFWNDYRAPGLPFVLRFAGLVASKDSVMRLTVVAFGGLLILFTWLIGRTLFDQTVGLVAAAGLAFSPTVVASSSAVWPDVPGAALGLGVLAILILSVRHDRVSWWVLTAGPVAVLATVFRFGAPLAIGIGAISIAIWRWSAVRRSVPQVASLAVLTAAGVTAVLAVPNALGGASSPLSAIRALADSNDFPIYQGFVDYAQLYDFLLLTPTGLVLALGLIWGTIHARRAPEGRAPFGLVLGIALVTVLALAVTLHGEYRYLVPAYPWLWIAAGYGVVKASQVMPRDLLLAGGTTVLVAFVLSGISDGGAEMANSKERFLELRTVSREIDSATDDGSCGVVTSYGPQVAWYSHCVTARYSLTDVRVSAASFPPDPIVYVLVVQDGKRQPEAAVLDEYWVVAAAGCVEAGEPDDGPLQYAIACALGSD